MSPIAPSERAEAVPFSGIRKVFDRITQLESTGKSVVNLCIGRPDFDTPAHIKARAARALEEGHVHYTPNAGIIGLRRAIADKLARENDVEVDPEGGVIVTIGATEAVFIALMAYLNPGDECLVPSPGWLSYYHMVTLAGGKAVPVPMKEGGDGFRLDMEILESRITPRTKILIITNPHNPTGSVMEAHELQQVLELARSRGVLVISDEIYERLTYDGVRLVSLAALPGGRDQVIIVNGFAKAYSMTGWRLGWLAGSPELLSPTLKIHQYSTVCATSFAQHGGQEALTASQECVEEMRAEFDARRQLMVEGLNRIPGISCSRPRGAFYVFPNISGWGMDSQQAATYLLEECGVGGVPGESFGAEGRDHIRFSYAASRQELKEALVRIEEGARRLSL